MYFNFVNYATTEGFPQGEVCVCIEWWLSPSTKRKEIRKQQRLKFLEFTFMKKLKTCSWLFTLMYGLWHILQHSVENTHALTFQLILLPCFSGADGNVCSEPQNAVSLAVGTVKEDREPKHM